MRTTIVALGFVFGSGCGSGADIGAPCSLDDPSCGDGAVCNFSATDGKPTCISADGDVDGDGLRNDKDYCNAGPGGEFDEDGDGIGDDCDPCPIAKPPMTPDPDGDKVDAPCDPDSSAPGDEIALFEGFNSGQLPAGWKMTGTWEFKGGEVVGTPSDPGNPITLTSTLPLLTTKVAALASYRIDSLVTGATIENVGVTTIDRRPAGVAAINCGGQRAGTSDQLLLETDTSSATKGFMNLFDTAARYRVAEKLEGINAACSLIADTEAGAAQTNTGGNAPSEGGVFARGAKARFQYVLVVQRK